MPVSLWFWNSVSNRPWNWLLPDRSRLFDAAPLKPPYSAAAPRLTICTSWIQLYPANTQIVPPSGSLTSTPSIM